MKIKLPKIPVPKFLHWPKFLRRQESVESLMERRGFLVEKLESVQELVVTLETEEANFLKEGRATTALQSTRRRLASRISFLRKDRSRWCTVIRMFQQQIEVINVDLSSREIIKDCGEISDLSINTDTVVEHAIEAEQMMEELAEQAEVNITICDPTMSTEEQSIMAEFEAEKGPEEKQARAEVEKQGADMFTADQVVGAARNRDESKCSS